MDLCAYYMNVCHVCHVCMSCMNVCMNVCMYECMSCMYVCESFSARVGEVTHPKLPIYSLEIYYNSKL